MVRRRGQGQFAIWKGLSHQRALFPAAPIHRCLAPEALLTGLLCFHATLQTVSLGIHCLGRPLDGAAARAVLLLGLVAAVLSTARAGGAAGASVPEKPEARIAPALLLLPLVGLACYLVLWGLALTRPDYSWDGNSYHLPPLHVWARAGSICWANPNFPAGEYINGYPKAAELFAFLLVTAFRNSHLAATANLCFLPLAVAGAACAARSLGALPLAAWSAAALLLLVPCVQWQCVTTYVDVAYASCVIAALGLLLAPGEQPSIASARWTRTLALGAATGLAAAVKPAGLLAVAAVLGAAFLLDMAEERRSAAPDARRTLLRAAAQTACALGVAGSVGGYWYLRDFLHTGSPLYPAGLTVAGHVLFPGRTVASILAGNTPPGLQALPTPLRPAWTWLQIGDWREQVLGPDGREGGLGWLWVLGCLPAIVQACGSPARRAAHTGSHRHPVRVRWLLAVVTGMFCLTPLNWWARFTLWLYGLGLPCLALLPAESGRSVLGSRIRTGWIGLCLLIGIGEGLASMLLLVRHSGPDEPALTYFRSFRGTALEQILRDKQPVGVGPIRGDGEKTLIYGRLCTPVGAREVTPLTGPETSSAGWLRAHGIRYLLCDDAVSPPALPGEVIERAEHAGGFWLLTLRHPRPGPRR